MKFFVPALLLALAGQSLAAISAYMTVSDSGTDKSILAEGTTNPTFKNTPAIELSNWSYNLEQTLNIGAGGSNGSGAGKITFNSLFVNKRVDANTPIFFQRMAAGKPVTCTIYLYKSLGDSSASQMFMSIQFRLAAFRSQSISAGDGDSPNEALNIDYGAMQINYSIQGPNGSLKTQPPAGWNRVKNVAETSNIAVPR